MKKIDATVLRETGYIAIWVAILSILTQAVFLVVGAWDYTVLLGNLLSAAAAVTNFLLMGITVQTAIDKDEKEAKNTVKISQSLRMLLLFVVLIIGLSFDCFNIWTVIIPLFFPRFAISFRPLFDKKEDREKGN